jgi:hypothetical protein
LVDLDRETTRTKRQDCRKWDCWAQKEGKNCQPSLTAAHSLKAPGQEIKGKKKREKRNVQNSAIFIFSQQSLAQHEVRTICPDPINVEEDDDY